LAILSKDEFISRIKSRLGEDLTDEDIAYLEDLTDTYEDLESRTDAEDWKAKYQQLDADWRKKYVDRFTAKEETFIEDAEGDVEDVEDTYEAPMTYEELFEQ
jgi:hypothetical protein